MIFGQEMKEYNLIHPVFFSLANFFLCSCFMPFYFIFMITIRRCKSLNYELLLLVRPIQVYKVFSCKIISMEGCCFLFSRFVQGNIFHKKRQNFTSSFEFYLFDRIVLKYLMSRNWRPF